MSSEVRIRDRCVCDGEYGTILYVGEVPPTKGEWFGVEWDDVSRGKHSGIHEGVQYFTCSVPNSGSFLRPKKADLGKTFVDAVQERYQGQGFVFEGEDERGALYVSVKQVEMVGLDKVAQQQSQLHLLTEVSLEGLLVSSAGPPGQISATTPNICSLDLSKNHLLSRWQVVVDIVSQLPQLTTLYLSGCQFLETPSIDSPALSNVTTLFLNEMNLTWNKVTAITRCTPDLLELHACTNQISSLDRDSLPRNLTLLNLEENSLSSWSEVCKLKNLPKLSILILNTNKIKGITSEVFQEGDFQMLYRLSLRNNLIEDWDSINQLAVLPSLANMKFKENPLSESKPAYDMRQLLISHLAGLQTLNGSRVTKRERQLAERFYLRHYVTDFAAFVEAPSTSVLPSFLSDTRYHNFQRLHPRYQGLIAVHGLPELEDVKSGKLVNSSRSSSRTSAMKEGLIAVTIKSSSDPSLKQLTKKLPVSMTVQKLKNLVQRLYKIDPFLLKLSYLDQKGSHEVQLDDELRQLSFYSMENGDSILIQC